MAVRMGMNRAQYLSLLLLFLVLAVSAGGQTIALKKNGNLYLKFARGDTLKRNQFDLSRVIDWQFDTTGKVDELRCAKEIDWNRSIQPFAWMAVSDFTGGQPSHSPSAPWMPAGGLVMPRAKLAFFIAGMVNRMGGDCVVLTIWDLVGSDSIRFQCGVLTDFMMINEAMRVVKGLQLPDSSVLIRLRMTDEPNPDREREEGNWFYQVKPTCDIRLLYKSVWYRELKGPSKWVMLDISGLDDPNYQIRETTNFGRGNITRLSDLPVDSSKTRIIDLWDIAQGKAPVDTTGRGN